LGHRYADDLEGQNDEQLEGLSAKVKLLKDVRGLVRWLRGPHSPVYLTKITIGIGNEVRESTVQLSQMVHWFISVLSVLSAKLLLVSLLERCVCGNIRYPCRDFPTNEQHGGAARLSVVVVHHLSSLCLLVLYHCMVVPTMKTRALTPCHSPVTSGSKMVPFRLMLSS